MKRAEIFFDKKSAGFLYELDNSQFEFVYHGMYTGKPVSLTMPVQNKKFTFTTFPPFFDGLLPEGNQLEGLLRQNKFDRGDFFSQLVAVGEDMVGAVTVKSATE